MARKKKVKIYEKVLVADVVAEGKTIAKVDDLVLFITGAIPGDVVDLKVTRKRKNYAETVPIKFHEYSKDRMKHFCEHFGVCGGCKWQHLPYEKQLHYKQKQVVDSLERIGKVDLPEILPIVGSNKTLYYRNKLDFAFSCRRWLTSDEISEDGEINDMKAVGFFLPGKFDRVLNIGHCWLQASPSNKIRNAIRDFTKKHDYSYYDHREKHGFMRSVVIRTSATGEVMVIIIFETDEKEKREALFEHLIEQFPDVNSWMYMINAKVNDSTNDLDAILYKGRDFIYEKMEDLRFKVGPKSFYQTNADQAYKLYDITRDFAGLTGDEVVYDLYTGTGTIANFVARKAKKVIGVEYVPEAIEDANENSRINKIDNTKFFAGDMKDVLTSDFIEEYGKPDVIIVDPPRAGMHPSVVETIANASPEKIVYVSCNPATQARDIGMLSDRFTVDAIQPVDMFPHTFHVENVVLLTKKL